MNQNQNNRRRGGNGGPGSGPGSPNFGQNIIILLIVAAVAYFIMNYGRSMIRDRRKGKSACGNACASCPMAGKCHGH